MPPIKIDNDTFSSILGAISITAWVVVFSPQIWTNFSTRSAEGLSLSFVVLWLIGDFFNIIGALLQNVQWVLTVLAIYYTVADIVLLGQCIIYRNASQTRTVDGTQHASVATPLIPKDVDVTKSRSNTKSAVLNVLALLSVCMVGTIGWYVGAIFSAPSRQPAQPEHPVLVFDFWGQMFGWGCAVLYLGSRLPQIVHNFKRGSTDGLSPLFFLFACLGNVTYVGSILIRDYGTSHYRRYLAINSSWLAGSAGTLLLDFIILSQTLYYNYVHDKGQANDDADDA